MILAACGGNVGLCMGLSLLSVVELFYFFTIRILFDKSKENRIIRRPRTSSI